MRPSFDEAQAVFTNGKLILNRKASGRTYVYSIMETTSVSLPTLAVYMREAHIQDIAKYIPRISISPDPGLGEFIPNSGHFLQGGGPSSALFALYHRALWPTLACNTHWAREPSFTYWTRLPIFTSSAWEPLSSRTLGPSFTSFTPSVVVPTMIS